MKSDKELQDLIQMSKYAGGRFDLVQAGGGNTSVKKGDEMYIKASGYLLSEVSADKGYTVVGTNQVLAILEDKEVLETIDKRKKDALATAKLQHAILIEGPRPSIETYLHAILYKYTFHVHAIAVNVFTSHSNWEAEVKSLYEEGLCIAYETPGIELALILKSGVETYSKTHGHLPKVIFLQNHGIIISSDELEDIERITEGIIAKSERKAGLDFSRYRSVTTLAGFYNKVFEDNHIAYLSEDGTLGTLMKEIDEEALDKPFSPDGFVFCGHAVLRTDILSETVFSNYRERYLSSPKIVLFNNGIYILAEDLKKAKMIEDVFKNNLLIAKATATNLTFLAEEEILYLGNWEAEKYRQKL